MTLGEVNRLTTRIREFIEGLVLELDGERPQIRIPLPNLQVGNVSFLYILAQRQVKIFTKILNTGTANSRECEVKADVELGRFNRRRVTLTTRCPALPPGNIGRELEVGTIYNVSREQAEFISVIVTVDSRNEVFEQDENDNTGGIAGPIRPDFDDIGDDSIPEPPGPPPPSAD